MATALRSHAPVGTSLTAPPSQLTPFVGRQMELAEVRRVLRTSRLVTLVGPGGSGKTRLAVEVAADVDRPHGRDNVTWADLATLADPALLDRHVSASLGLAESLERSALETLVEKIRTLSLLLVLDNCEHLVDACARLVQALLSSCPDLTVLATSREALGVGGESAWTVPPLSLPASADPTTADGVGHSEAVELFVARAQAVQSSFVLTDLNAPAVAYVCRQLGGIPLAIELAAARMNVLAVEQIADRLDDVFGLLSTRSRTALPRHRTLRSAIDWSYDLLDSTEQTLFRRLAVFVAGFTLESVESVCSGAGVPAPAMLDLVSALVDKSLVRAEPLRGAPRFSLLEPVRQYAWEKLDEAGELHALRARHAACFLGLVESMEGGVRGGARGTEQMARLEREHGNLRAAAEWCAEDVGRVELQLRLDSALLWFYFAQGSFEEPRKRLTRGLEWSGVLDGLVRGRAYTALGYQAIWLGDYDQALVPLRAGVALLRQADDREALSFALTGLAASVAFAGDAASAHSLLDEAQAAVGGPEGSRAGGFRTAFLYAFASYWRGVVLLFAGDVAGAREAFEASVQVAREHGDHPSMAHPLGLLARVLTIQGHFREARACLADSLPIHAANDDRWGLAEALEAAAQLAGAVGALDRAARLLGAGDALRESMGLTLPPHQLADRSRMVAAIEAGIGRSAYARELAAGRNLTLRQISVEALGEDTHPRPTQGAPGLGTTPRVIGAESADVELAVLALGPLRIFRRGREVESGAWGSAKPRELLLYLLCHPEGANREQIGLALWPDASHERVANSFHVTLHRLRKALGDAGCVARAGERYHVARDLRMLFDAEVFERRMGVALQDLRGAPDGVDSLRAALSWYRGPFLEDEVVGDWHLAVRDRLRRTHLDGLLALGAFLFGAGRWAEAAETYARVIADDDLHEEGYRQLMLSLARAGDRSQALRLYQRLCALLEKELGARPEPETVAIFERLQGAAAL